MSVAASLLIAGFKIAGGLVAARCLHDYISVSHKTNNGWKDLFFSIAIITGILGMSWRFN